MMHHLLIAPNKEGVLQAANLIKSGKLVAFPTETVYGLGANALDADAVKSIFTAKGRPLTDPLIVHVAKQNDSYELVDLTSSERVVFDSLSTTFWPGPLTLIVKASNKIPLLVTADTGFVGVRCPNHPLAVELLEASGLPIAAPSANRFGHVSPTTAAHVLADLGEKGVHILNGEAEGSLTGVSPHLNCEFGIESSVVKIDEANKQLIIFRQGAVSQHQLERCLASLPGAEAAWKVVAIQRAVKMHSTDNSGPAAAQLAESESHDAEQEKLVGQQAPGQAITHYAPDVPCSIVRSLNVGAQTGTGSGEAQSEGELRLTVENLRAQCVVVDFAGKLRALQASALAYRDLSESGSAAEAARCLFDALRWAENVPGAGRVLIAAIPVEEAVAGTLAQADETDMTLGLADRIFRAASGVYIDLSVL
jgi:tRNA threonylcarbamoyl adenosine modification protein (Sua5/YciO/YrdC/YwlC family)